MGGAVGGGVGEAQDVARVPLHHTADGSRWRKAPSSSPPVGEDLAHPSPATPITPPQY